MSVLFLAFVVPMAFRIILFDHDVVCVCVCETEQVIAGQRGKKRGGQNSFFILFIMDKTSFQMNHRAEK